MRGLTYVVLRQAGLVLTDLSKVIKINPLLVPADVFDMYGELYMTSGNYLEPILRFEKCVELKLSDSLRILE